MWKMTSGKPYGDKDRDMIRARWSSLSALEKGRYIWFYYKVYIVIILILLAAALYFVRDIRSDKPEEAFYVMVLDSELDEAQTVQLQSQLELALAIDTASEKCVVENAYSSGSNAQSEATVATYMMSGRVDLVIAPEERFNTYAATGYLVPLTDEAYADLLVVQDAVHLFYAEQVDYSGGGAVQEIPMHPHEQTAGSACYGIYLTEGLLTDYVIGVMANSPHTSLTAEGLQYFLK